MKLMLKSAVAVASLAFVLLACATKEPMTAEPMTAEQKMALIEEHGVLSGEEIISTIVGNTMTGPSVNFPGRTWIEYYAPEGKIMGKWTDDSDKWTGRWTVDGPIMCWDYEGTQYDECNLMKLEDDKVTFLEIVGSAVVSGTLITGNPEQF